MLDTKAMFPEIKKIKILATLIPHKLNFYHPAKVSIVIIVYLRSK